MVYSDQKDTIFYDIGADETCRINDEKNYCNGPLRPMTNYRLKLRAFTTNGFQDSWTVPFSIREFNTYFALFDHSYNLGEGQRGRSKHFFFFLKDFLLALPGISKHYR